KSRLIRTARDVAEGLVSRLPAAPSALQVPQPQPGGRHSAVLAPDPGPPAGPPARQPTAFEPTVSPASRATRGYPPVSHAGSAGAVTHDGP
ncbi:MAG TPA: hypothetical protein VIH64_07865, partial [Streptosporangiaceae bacterium]